MKATKAYIASLGTTGVLLGASLLMLAVVSAVVAFNAWPTGQVPTRVQTLVLADQAPAKIRLGATHANASRAASAARAAARAVAGRRAHVTVPGATIPSVQRVAGERVAGGHTTTPPPGGPIKVPVDQAPIDLPPFDPGNPDPAGLVGAAADQVQSTTTSGGGALGGDGGQALTTTGQSTADTVRSVPLPGPIHPGG